MMKQRNSPPIEFNSRKIDKKSHKLELHFEKRKEKKTEINKKHQSYSASKKLQPPTI